MVFLDKISFLLFWILLSIIIQILETTVSMFCVKKNNVFPAIKLGYVNRCHVKGFAHTHQTDKHAYCLQMAFGIYGCLLLAALPIL